MPNKVPWKIKGTIFNDFFLTMITISLFCCEKAFILMNIGWLGKTQQNNVTWKRRFYSHLNMEDVTDADYAHAKRVGKETEIKNLGKYHDLYVRSNVLLLADVFENFRNIEILKIFRSIEIMNLIRQNFFQLLDWHGKQIWKR